MGKTTEELAFDAEIWPLRPTLLVQARRWGLGDDAEDVVQEVMLTMMSKNTSGMGLDRIHVRRLAHQVLIGQALNARRARHRRLRLLSAIPPPEHIASTEESVSGSDLVTTILGNIPPTQARALALLMSGFTVAEIAVNEGVTYAAAAKYLARGRARVRQLLADPTPH